MLLVIVWRVLCSCEYALPPDIRISLFGSLSDKIINRLSITSTSYVKNNIKSFCSPEFKIKSIWKIGITSLHSHYTDYRDCLITFNYFHGTEGSAMRADRHPWFLMNHHRLRRVCRGNLDGIRIASPQSFLSATDDISGNLSCPAQGCGEAGDCKGGYHHS